MKCPKCDGTGFVPTNVFGVNGAIKCDFCDGTGVFITNAVEPMTNEEHLHSCNTEQLAEELLAWWFDGANTYSQFGLFKWEIDEAKEKIMKWLKEKHND